MSDRSFDWSQLIKVADELAKRTEEPYLRTAVGRAYYYAFHLARKRLTDNQFSMGQGGDSHRLIWEKFEGSPDPRCQRLGVAAKFLKERRQRADYEANYPRIEEEVALVIERARKFAQDLAELPANLPRNTGLKA